MNINYLKNKVKNSKVLTKFYNSVIKILYKMEWIIPNAMVIKLQYRLSTGIKLDYKNLHGFDQKIQWMKAFYHDYRYIQCADKYAVRDYVTNCGCAELLNELYAVYDSVDGLTFENLPNQFIIKMTNGCGENIVCLNKENMDEKKVRETLARYWNKKVGIVSGELHYSQIKPRIIIEKYLGTDYELPVDYKFFCFDGEPSCVSVLAERDIETCGHAKIGFFDENWNFLNYVKKELELDSSKYVKPDNLQEMFEYARKLSKGFPFVRVDLYNINGEIYFGELTFTPTGGGTSKIYTSDANDFLGEKFFLPSKTKERTWKAANKTYRRLCEVSMGGE